MEIDRNAQRMRECPHFDFCNVVRCPLDVLICQRVKLTEDKAKCQLSKGRRMRLGSDMATKGLNRYEIAALVRTYGSLEIAFKRILNQNFCVKNEAIFSGNSKGWVNKEDIKLKGRLGEFCF